jgi:hypothetical protein
MDVFLPYSRLLDRLAHGYKLSNKFYRFIVLLMGWHNDGLKQFTGSHKHAKAYEIKEKLGSSTFDSYYKFTFVRNPFDFLASLYFYNLTYIYAHNHEMIVNMSFLEFLRWYISEKPPIQLEYLTDQSNKHRIVDYIGRFETLEKDIAIIQETLGLEVIRQVKHMNPSVKRKIKDYKEYYDKEGIKLVSDYFQADLDLLGYSFDGVGNRMPIMDKN